MSYERSKKLVQRKWPLLIVEAADISQPSIIDHLLVVTEEYAPGLVGLIAYKEGHVNVHKSTGGSEFWNADILPMSFNSIEIAIDWLSRDSRIFDAIRHPELSRAAWPTVPA